MNCLPAASQGREKKKKTQLTAKTTSQETLPNVIEGAVWWFVQQCRTESPSGNQKKRRDHEPVTSESIAQGQPA